MASDGLEKLTEYLNATRRQSENAIDIMNVRVVELEKEIDEWKNIANQYKEERDYLFNYSEQLKLENSKKWRLQERDDWKSLVDSVQLDRERLQDECFRLEAVLEKLQPSVLNVDENKENLAPVRQQLFTQTSQPDQVSLSSPKQVSFADQVKGSGLPDLSITTSASSSPSQQFSGIASPRTLTRELKKELEKAKDQMEVDRLAAVAERKSHEEEISRLRQVLLQNESAFQENRSGVFGGFWNAAPPSAQTTEVSLINAPSMTYVNTPMDIINFLFNSRPTNMTILTRTYDKGGHHSSSSPATETSSTRVLHV